jgi:acyl-CoA thioesterase-2
MTDALADLVALLDLEPIEVNLFRGVQPDDDRQRVFGGQVAGQALVAASRTVEEPGRLVHSLHAYFLRPGDPNVPILYEVDRIRDGRSFTTRRVVAVQHGRAIFNLQASFHEPEPGFDFQIVGPVDVAPPESLPDHRERIDAYLASCPDPEVAAKLGTGDDRPRPIDLRYVTPELLLDRGSTGNGLLVWLRANGSLPDDPVLHACIVTYASDMTLLDAAIRPLGKSWLTDSLMMASLDHAMWFHRPFRADEWLLYEQRAFSSSSARALAGGSIFTADGQLAVNVAQEGLIREIRTESP